ncbi:MAG: SpaA isopeptide-forming pilin-related protein [Saccharofermentanales bacterium]
MKTIKTQTGRMGTTVISLVLALLLAATPIFGPRSTQVLGAVGTPELGNLDFTITAGFDENGNLSHTEPLELEVSFDIPVLGDGGGSYFEKGDTIPLTLSEHFSFDPIPSGTIELVFTDDEGNTHLVGHVTLANDANGHAIAAIVLDGDDNVFNGYYEGVSAEFDARLVWNGESEEDDEGNLVVRILEKEVDFLFPGDTITYTMEKTGALSADASAITWTVVITGIKDTVPPAPIDLAGYIFTDDLTNVGAFVAGSFSLDASLAPNAAGSLSYEFPANSTSPQTITFQTKVSNNILTNGGTVANTGRLQKDGKPVTFDRGTVSVPAPQFTKTGGTAATAITNGVYNPANQTIIWTVDVDSAGRLLSDLIITDVLNAGLTFVSANWYVYDEGTSTWPTSPDKTWSAVPANSKYEIGNFQGKGRLLIVTQVPTPASGFVVDESTFNNRATVTWTGGGGTSGSGGTGNPGVGTGYKAMTKAAGTVDMTTHQIPWTVSVNLAHQGTVDQLAALTIYDLIVHSAATTNADLLAAVTSSGGTTPAWPTGLSIGTSGVARSNGQKYVTGTAVAATGSSHLTVTAIELYNGTDHIGTLIKATGLKNDTVNKIQFTTQVLDPAILAGNSTTADPTRVYNTATLTSGTSRISTAQANARFNNQILSKELLHRDEVDNDHDDEKTINANNKTINVNNGFHYGYKEVIFRFNINASSLDFENVLTDPPGGFGPVTVTDTLPEGWEFVPFESGDDFLLYHGGSFQSGGNRPATGSLVANGSPIDLDVNDGIVTASFNRTGDPQTAAFTFPGLKTPYVLLIKARPTLDTLDGYLLENQPTTERNTLNIKSTTWTPGKTVFQDVVVDGTILHKTVFVDDSMGVARWTIEYTPMERPVDIGWEDQIPAGIDLRTDSNGNLIWLDSEGNRNITVTELILDSAGNYSAGTVLSQADHEEYISYDPETRLMTFMFPYSDRAYRLVYLTDITGVPGYVSNEVHLISEEVGGVTDSDGFNVLDSHGSATMKRSAFIIIYKTTSDGETPLEGVQFTLYFTHEDGSMAAVKAEKVTDVDGQVAFYGLAPGNYILKETQVPSGYAQNETEYHVTVLADKTVTVEGQSNPITIRNFEEEEELGNLTLSKLVAGNAGQTDLPFTFTLEFKLDGEVVTGVFEYIGVNGGPSGAISSGGSVQLQHGQSIKMVGLPAGLEYSIVEDEADGYITEADEAAGTILSGQTSQAVFTNTRNLGVLNIHKTVDGVGGDKSLPFTFELTLTDADEEVLEGIYDYTGVGVPDGTISSGDQFQLAHDQAIIITGLPLGSLYQVVELEADQDDYETTATGDTGTFTAEEFYKYVEFVNTNDTLIEEDDDIPKTGDTGNEEMLTVFIGSLTLLIVLISGDIYLRYRKKASRRAR